MPVPPCPAEMGRIVLDAGSECPQQYTARLSSADVLLSSSEYHLASQPARHERFNSEAELMTRLGALNQEGSRDLVVLYDSKKLLPLLLRAARRHGYFRTRLVFGTKSMLWHDAFVREALHYAVDRIRNATFRRGGKGSVPPGAACVHNGTCTKDECASSAEPQMGTSDAKGRESPIAFFAPSYFRRVTNDLLPLPTVERIGPAALHASLDGVGRGAYIFAGGSRPLRFPYFYLKSPQSIRPLRRATLAGTWVNLSCFSNGYAHWLLDLMPALYLAREQLSRNADAGLLVNSWHSFQSELAVLIDLADRPVRLLEQGKCLEVENLLNLVVPVNKAAVANGFRPFPPRSYLEPMVSHILRRSQEKTSRSERPKKIYVGRAAGLERSVTNDRELFDQLASRGFTQVDLERLSVAEQALLFNEAEVVVAPHGAGLANLVFGSRLKLVELMHPHLVRSYFYHIAGDWGFDYRLVMGTTAANGREPSFSVAVSSVLRELDS